MKQPMRILGLIAAALAAAGCDRGAGDRAAGNAAGEAIGNAANEAAPAAADVVGQADGLRVGGRELRFGAAQEEVLARLAFRGRPPVETNAECGAGPTQIARYPDGLGLLFQEGRFAGWEAGAPTRSVRTAEGIAPGSTRAELARAYPGVGIEESTLGTEFAAGEIGGLLDGAGETARVAAIRAGLTCHFR